MRAKGLSKLKMGDFSLYGYSVAGEASVIIAPELDCAFDIGTCPREALTVNHILLSHGHTDHFAGLPYYFAQRDFQGIEGGKVLLPAKLAEPVEELMSVWGRIDGQLPPHEIIPMKAGDDYEIRRGLFARAFATRHRSESLGYSLIEVRHKLKSKYAGLAGPEIVAMKTEGTAITDRVEIPLLAFLGDTAPADYSSLPYVAKAKVLLIECTFFEEEHRDRARHGKHLHVQDLPGILEGMENEHIVLIHVTRRTHLGFARKQLKGLLNKSILDRVSFLMDRKHMED